MSDFGTFGWQGIGQRAFEFPRGVAGTFQVAVSPLGRARLRYNDDDKTFEVSIDTAAYVPFLLGPLPPASGFEVVLGESVERGNPLVLRNVAGEPRAFLASAAGTVAAGNAIALAQAAGNAGDTIFAQQDDTLDVPDGEWDAIPSVLDVGRECYVSATVTGNLTLTAPAGSGQTIKRIGILARGGAGALRVAIDMGPILALA